MWQPVLDSLLRTDQQDTHSISDVCYILSLERSLFVVIYTAMYCIWDQRSSPSIEEWGLTLVHCDGQMVSGNRCSLNFLTYVVQLKENPRKTSVRNWPYWEFNPGPFGWETRVLPFYHSSGPVLQISYQLKLL